MSELYSNSVIKPFLKFVIEPLLKSLTKPHLKFVINPYSTFDVYDRLIVKYPKDCHGIKVLVFLYFASQSQSNFNLC